MGLNSARNFIRLYRVLIFNEVSAEDVYDWLEVVDHFPGLNYTSCKKTLKQSEICKPAAKIVLLSPPFELY